MPTPKDCPVPIYKLMQKSWDETQSARPSFAEILAVIDEEYQQVAPKETMYDKKNRVTLCSKPIKNVASVDMDTVYN